MTTHNFTIEPVKTKSGDKYRVRDESGEILLERARVPLLEAARHAARAGKDGKVTMTWYGSGSPALSGEISALCKRTVIENARFGPVFAKFYEFPQGDDDQEDNE
jgi:hypothetical protein